MSSEQQQQEPLWPNGKRLGLISVSGEHEAGKSLFQLTIDRSSIAVIDTEKSVEPYASAFGLQPVLALRDLATLPPGNARIDINAIAGTLVDQSRRADVFQQIVRAIPAGRWRVIGIDCLTDIEAALVEWVKKNPAQFGYTAGQIASAGALAWGAVKTLEKQLLLELMGKCECVVVCRHMRSEFAGGRPTGKREAKGFDSIDELSSLSLELVRTADKAGVKPQRPAGIVIKHRLAAMVEDAETGEFEMVDLLPPRLPEATPAAIRKYIENPPNWKKLKESERAEERGLSEDERLVIQARMAEDQRLAAEARLAVQTNAAVLVKPVPAAGSSSAAQVPEKGPTTPVSPTGHIGTEAPAPVAERVPFSELPTSDTPNPPGSVSETPMEAIRRLHKQLAPTPDEWQEILALFDCPIHSDSGLRKANLADEDVQERIANHLSLLVQEMERDQVGEELANADFS